MVASRFEASSSVRLATPGTVSWMLMSLASSQGGVLGKRVMGFLLVRGIDHLIIGSLNHHALECGEMLIMHLFISA